MFLLVSIGNCATCYYAAAGYKDFQLSGKSQATSKKGKGLRADSLCCGYAASGMSSEKNGDCIQIPGAKLDGKTGKYICM